MRELCSSLCSQALRGLPDKQLGASTKACLHCHTVSLSPRDSKAIVTGLPRHTQLEPVPDNQDRAYTQSWLSARARCTQGTCQAVVMTADQFLIMHLKYSKNNRVLLPKGSPGMNWLRSFL